MTLHNTARRGRHRRRIGEQIERRGVFAFPLLVLLLFLLAARPEDAPERLCEIPDNAAVFAVQNDRAYVYQSSTANQPFSLAALPLSGGRPTMQSALPVLLNDTQSVVYTSENTVRLFTWKMRGGTPTLGEHALVSLRPFRSAPTAPRRSAGIFLQHGTGFAPGEIAEKLPAPRPLLLRQYALSRTRKPSAIPAFFLRTSGTSADQVIRGAVVDNDTLYWVRPGARPALRIQQAEVTRTEIAADQELVATSLADGSERCVVQNIAATTGLFRSGDFLFWEQPRPYPDSRKDWRFLRLSAKDQNKTRGLLRDYHGISTPVFYRDRFYWIEPEPDTDNQTATEGSRIVTTHADGSERRVVLNLRDDSSDTSALRLFSHEDRFYLVFARRQRSSRLDEPISRLGVARLSETVDEQFLDEMPARWLPRTHSSQFDTRSDANFWASGAYFYFLTVTEEASWLDVLYERSTTRSVRQLHRVRLP